MSRIVASSGFYRVPIVLLFCTISGSACSLPVVTEFDAQLTGAFAPPVGVPKAMRFVPGGYYLRGTPPAYAAGKNRSAANESPSMSGRSNEGPGRRVGVSSFYLDETPVTYADFRPYVQAAGAKRNHHWDYPIYNKPDQPVTGLNWFEAACYCNWRSAALGLAPAYFDTGERDAYGYPVWDREDQSEGFRLPTEAEFEYAAVSRAARENDEIAPRYPWGDTFDRRLANYDEGRGVPRGRWWRLSRVQDQHRNDLGLYGMSGNVWEWNDDWYAADAYERADSSNPRGHRQPKGSGSSGRFVKSMRGGSWGGFRPDDLRIRRRSYSAPGAYHFDVGFRCLLPGETVYRLQSEGRSYNHAGAGSGTSAGAMSAATPLPALCRERITSRLVTDAENARKTATAGADPALRFGEDFRRRLGEYLADYFAESLYFHHVVDRQKVLTPRELADIITDGSLRHNIHPLFLTGIMRAESGMGTVSFPRWFNNPMAYHWQNVQMANGLPQYRPGPGRNRKYRTLAEGFDAYARGVRQRFYIEAARGDLYRFHYIYVGYDAQEWMTALTTVYREVLGVDFTKTFPTKDCGRLIYLDWDEIR